MPELLRGRGNTDPENLILPFLCNLITQDGLTVLTEDQKIAAAYCKTGDAITAMFSSVVTEDGLSVVTEDGKLVQVRT